MRGIRNTTHSPPPVKSSFVDVKIVITDVSIFVIFGGILIINELLTTETVHFGLSFE
jgi:hypothetical protein